MQNFNYFTVFVTLIIFYSNAMQQQELTLQQLLQMPPEQMQKTLASLPETERRNIELQVQCKKEQAIQSVNQFLANNEAPDLLQKRTEELEAQSVLFRRTGQEPQQQSTLGYLLSYCPMQ